ncbi:MAG: helix-turn-helix domain-containing protein [Solobacterium sp.]|nr:helix-turn-helix domain-containing protein [Solobacterium sp.]
MSENLLFQGETVHSQRILYTPSPFAKNNLFYLQETGSLRAAKVHKSARSWLDSYLFLLITEGSGTVVSGNSACSLKQGDCVFLDCHIPYWHESSEDLWSLRWVHFSGTTMPSIYRKFMERSGSCRFSAADVSRCTFLLDTLFALGNSESYVRDMELHETLSGLLTMIMKDCWSDTNNPRSHSLHNLEAVVTWLHEHYTEKISLDELSERFFINKYYLTRLFKRQYGMTISDFILELRIRRSKELLRFSGESMEAIAEQCGFYDLAYFSRKFKKTEGTSPSVYRRQWL